jgi:hypothetical protein
VRSDHAEGALLPLQYLARVGITVLAQETDPAFALKTPDNPGRYAIKVGDPVFNARRDGARPEQVQLDYIKRA